MRKRYRYLNVSVLIGLVAFTIIPFVAAQPRKTYLTNFLIDNQKTNKGFVNTNFTDSVDFEATVMALEMINYYNLFTVKDWFGTKTDKVNGTRMQKSIKGKVGDMIDAGTWDIYELYYMLKSIDILNGSIGSDREDEIKSYLDKTFRSGGGFAATNVSSYASVASTYFVIKIHDLIGKSLDNKDLHIDWLLNCQNSDGGFGGNSSMPSTVVNTYYAVFALDNLDTLDDVDEKEVVDYIEQFYVDNEADEKNYGGYKPTEDATRAILSSTYYCVQVLSILDNKTMHEETTKWVLSLQNFYDGGFADNTDARPRVSSVIGSYFAFHILKSFDENLLYMDEEIFMVQFNWIIFIIVMSVLGVAIAVVIMLRRRRKI